MNGNEKRAFWISVVTALMAVFLLYSYTQEKSDTLNKQFGIKSKVVIAKQDILEMATIDDSMLEIVERPLPFIQPSAILEPEMAIGQVALAPIKKGEQILETKILTPGPLTGLANQIAPGNRALTIPIDEVRGVAKLIKPGDRVDILAALDVGKGPSRRREVKTIMEDVPIIATGVRIRNELPRLLEKGKKQDFIRPIRGDVEFNNVTVEVDPKGAQSLVYLLSTSPGSIFLTLRHPTDGAPVIRSLSNTTIDTIVGRAPASLINRTLNKPKTVPRTSAPKKPRKRGRFEEL